MKSERGAFVRGSDPPSGHSVHNTASDTVAGAGQASDTKTVGRWCVENRRRKIWILLRWQKISIFSGLREERRTPRATSRPLDHGSTWYLRGRYLWPCPTRSVLAVGWFYVEIEGLLSRELFFIGVLTTFNVKTQVPPRAAALTN